jgi:hypothetical protein
MLNNFKNFKTEKKQLIILFKKNCKLH